MKPCRKCGGVERYKNGRCTSCARSGSLSYYKSNPGYNNRWRKNNPDRYREVMLLRAYGITLEAWNNMLRGQDFCCALCREPFDMTNTRDMHTDHDHQTGTVRGILHQLCNLNLGHYESNKPKHDLFEAYLRGKTA